MAIKRDEKGRFIKGSKPNPNGRPSKPREQKFYEITLSAVTYDDWKAIVGKAVEQAKRGDYQARKFLAEHLIGLPVQKTELLGFSVNPANEVHIEDLSVVVDLIQQAKERGE